MGTNFDLGAAALVIGRATTGYRGSAALGIPLTGLAWSIGVWIAHEQEITATGLGIAESFLLVSLGGLSQMLALWVGFSAVAWAMVRALNGSFGFVQMLLLTSRSATPLWLAAPAAAIALQANGNENLSALVIACLCGTAFVIVASYRLASEINWSLTRATIAIAATIIFLVSFVSLTT